MTFRSGPSASCFIRGYDPQRPIDVWLSFVHSCDLVLRQDILGRLIGVAAYSVNRN